MHKIIKKLFLFSIRSKNCVARAAVVRVPGAPRVFLQDALAEIARRERSWLASKLVGRPIRVRDRICIRAIFATSRGLADRPANVLLAATLGCVQSPTKFHRRFLRSSRASVCEHCARSRLVRNHGRTPPLEGRRLL